MTSKTEALLKEVEILKNLLVARATGVVPPDGEYHDLRFSLINNASISAKLPRFVHTCRSLDEFWGYIKPKSPNYAGRRTILKDAFDPVLTWLEQTSKAPVDSTADTVLPRLDAESVHAVWQRAVDRRASDPDGAITLARTLLENVCKGILDDLKVEYEGKADLPKLYSCVAAHLNLSPSQHTEKIFKQILGGCQAVVEGLGAMRSRLGDAHGQGKNGVKPATRHAELAVNLAGTMATFLVATWDAKRGS